ncbi:LOW QUALITY PROTEIN: putative elongator complex protein 1 [Haliotis rubra]|uniref:LOW QUALITY PROTEIN: putative elongator complex protein 1 n=1 Tax=Haliotis rubra TaxID=36100 RepID=UPI001EE50A87|nr:LOW QUALITY PROTEIN: putative elongator complex protein 1 [Haliotis rubra]
MAWSPDLEVLVLATGDETLIMMTREFDPITEVSQHPQDTGEAALVDVGWGKKETQFHGSEGKAAAQEKAKAYSSATSWDDRRPRISWRGDGQFFVVSSISPHTGGRQLHVWTRDCSHHSSSEPVDGLEQTLAWRPSGSLVACSHMRPNKHDVVFFEKNGLRHGEFTLPFPVNKVKVREVLWNMESTVLAVWCEEMCPDRLNQHPEHLPVSYVQLWTVNNYHWYLKQSLQFPAAQRVLDVQWDPEHGYRMHIVCSGAQYLQYTWSWVTCHSFGKSADDLATVTAIDGHKVLVTPMRQMVVPPPLSAFQLELPAPGSQVTFGPTGLSNDIAVMLSDERLAVYHLQEEAKDASDASVKVGAAGGTGFSVQCRRHSLQGVYSFDYASEIVTFPLHMHHLTWISPDCFLFCGLDTGNTHSVLYRAQLATDKLTVRSSLHVENLVHRYSCQYGDSVVAVQLCDGTVLRYLTDDDSLLPWNMESGQDLQLSHACNQMSVCLIGGEEVVLGLTDRYRFYVNDKEIASNCTSFAVHDEFLLLTTLSHTCRCISRHTRVRDLPSLSDGKAHPFDESVRRVERGSRIVTVVPEDTKLVLQMPRGNLEVIHPRALVLSAVRKYLDRQQYKDAFLAMRKHRINMNLMYDHDPQMFCDHIQLFVSQVEAVNHLNLFLTDLQEEDVTITMYTAAYNRHSQPDSQVTSKVDRVCDCVREALTHMDRDKRDLMKEDDPDAITLPRHRPDCETRKEGVTVTAEETLKYLLFLVDVNELYDVALGSYDFDLVLMVAEKSQKDPKEYIPFLNKLRRMEDNYRRFAIDQHLRRFRKALQHIAGCGDDKFQECLTFVEEHKLYGDALKLFAPGTSQFKQLATLYGNYLCEKNRSDEAGVMYIKAEEWELALEAFTACNNWRQMFCLTVKLGYSSEKEAEIARQCARQLQSMKNFNDAAVVFERYAEDVEEAIVCLIEGALWEEALRMMHQHRRTDFIETNLKTALLECHEQHLETLEEYRDNFEKHKKRLSVVREQREKQKLEILDGDVPCNNMDSDLFSDTSSATGASLQSSHYSYNSQRSTVISRRTGVNIEMPSDTVDVTISVSARRPTGQSLREETHGTVSERRPTGQSLRGDPRDSLCSTYEPIPLFKTLLQEQEEGDKLRWSLKEGSQYEDCALIDALAKIITAVDSLKEEVNSLMRALVQFHYDALALSLHQQLDSFLTLIDKSIPCIWLEESLQDAHPILGPNMTSNAIAQAMQQNSSSNTREQKDPVLMAPPKRRKDVRWRLHMVHTGGDH